MTVRIFEVATLTTTPSSTIEEEVLLDEVNEEPVQAPGVESCCVTEVLQASITKITHCSACYKGVEPPIAGTKFFKCPYCNIRRKVTTLTVKYRATINVEVCDGSKQLQIPSNVIQEFVDAQQLSLNDKDSVEEFMLGMEEFKIELRHNQITKM